MKTIELDLEKDKSLKALSGQVEKNNIRIGKDD